MDNEKCKRYFNRTFYNIGFIYLLFLMLLLLVINPLFGFICFAIIVFWFLRVKAGIPSDAELDKIVQSRFEDLKERAMMVLGLEDDEIYEIDPIVLGGYVYDDRIAKSADGIKKGKDNKYRSRYYQSCIFFFTQNEIHCFSRTINVTSNEQNESSSVNSYDDITAVTSHRNSIDKKNDKVEYENFVLTSAGGTTFTCAVNDSNEVQNLIKSIRGLIKKKKMI